VRRLPLSTLSITDAAGVTTSITLPRTVLAELERLARHSASDRASTGTITLADVALALLQAQIAQIRARDDDDDTTLSV
jgi:hypothetical protein